MKLEIFKYLFFTILLFASAFGYAKIAKIFGIVDTPNHRSSHIDPTVRGGGIIFLIALWLFYIYSGFNYSLVILGISIIAGVSFIDDINPLPPKVRFPFQIVSVVLIVLYVYGDIDPWSLFLIIAGVAFINAFNFMDGINAITGLYGLVVLGGFLIIDYFIESFIDYNLLIFILISIAIFGFFNFRKKALFFAGDVGSITLAMIILFVSFKFLKAFNSPLILIFLGIYGIDTFMTILRRLKLKQKLSEAHREHLYQKIVDKINYGHLKTALLYASLQLFFIAVVIFSLRLDLYIQYIITLIGLLLLTFIYFYTIKKLDKI